MAADGGRYGSADPLCVEDYMTTMTLDISPELYHQLQEAARRAGRPMHELVASWLQERLISAQQERARAIAALQAAGMVVAPSPEMQAHAAQASMSLAEVQAALDRVGGIPLSDVSIAQRGPKACGSAMSTQ